MKIKHLIFLLSIAILLSACTAPPSKKIIRETIAKYFEERHCRVKDITIGEIKGLPLVKKRYMGKEGYTIEIKSITIEILKDIPSLNYKKGQFLIFSNGIIQMRSRRDMPGEWEISNISGIPAI